MIRWQCPQCFKAYVADDSLGGTSTQCQGYGWLGTAPLTSEPILERLTLEFAPAIKSRSPLVVWARFVWKLVVLGTVSFAITLVFLYIFFPSAFAWLYWQVFLVALRWS